MGDMAYFRSRGLAFPVLAVARFLCGFGAGNRSVCRANVARLTLMEQRLQFLTVLQATVYFGYAVTPGAPRRRASHAAMPAMPEATRVASLRSSARYRAEGERRGGERERERE